MPRQFKSKRSEWAAILIAAGMYFLFAKLGLALATAPEQVTAIWPPTGIAISFLVIYGYRLWPAVTLGAFAANILTQEPVLVAVAIAAGNTLQALASTWVFRFVARNNVTLHHVNGIAGLLTGAVSGTLISATIGTTSLWLGGLVSGPQFEAVWLLWWLGDSMGAIVFAPLILTWVQRDERPVPRAGILESVLCLVTLAVVGHIVFQGLIPDPSQMKFVISPLMIWSAYRLEQRLTAISIALVTGLALLGLLSNSDTFRGGTMNEKLLVAQSFMAVIAITSLVIGSVAREQRDTQAGLEERIRERTAELEVKLLALQESQQQQELSQRDLQDFINGLTTFTAKVGTDGRILLAGRAAQIASGLSLEELFKMNFLEGSWFAYDPQVQARVRAAFKDAVGGKAINYHEKIQVFGDKVLIIDFSLQPVFDSDGKVIHLIAEGRDITAQKNAEEAVRKAETELKSAFDQLETRVQERTAELTSATEALRLSEQRLQAIMDNSSAVIHVKDTQGRYVLVNREWENVNRKSRGEVIGRTLFDIYPREAAEALASNDRLILSTGKAMQFDEFVPHGEGGDRYYLSNKFPLLDQNGVPYAICGIATDITERKKIEERERLAREAAEKANRAKDEFLAVVSHELRTPLSPILGWTRMLRARQLPAEQVEHALEVIERNVRVQSQLIEDLLDISRIITGKLRITIKPTRLVPVIQAALETVRPAAESKNITIEAMLGEPDDLVRGDAERLQQVAWNLLANAIKFTPRNGHITVALRRAQSNIIFSVRDDGQGIHPDFLPFMFNRFSQADSSTTRRQGGLGLGLAIVRHIVELHGGIVSAQSEGPNLGSTFSVSLPINSLAVSSGETPSRYGKRLSETNLSSALAGMRVLIVDDEPDTLEFVGTALEHWGATVSRATSVREAIPKVESLHPDVVVSDIGMPGEDGYSFIRQLRELTPDSGSRTPAIALTAYARSEDRARILSAGYEMHISKPVDPVELANAVASLVRR